MLFFASAAQANALPDSLVKQLKGKSVKEQVTLLKQTALTEFYRSKENALNLAYHGIEIAVKNEDYEMYADVLNTKGIIFGQYGQFDSSYACYEQALQLCRQHNLPHIQKKVGININIV